MPSAERLDTTLALLTLTALGLGIAGVVRARRWAGRRAQRRRGARLLAALGLLPSVLVIVVGAAFPRLAEAYRTEPDLVPPADTFDRGLEWLFDGMQAVLDARRG